MTPLQASAAATGRRYFACVPAVYSALRAQTDQARDYPQGEGTQAVTLHGLPAVENLQSDTNGRVLISLEVWRFTPADDVMLAPVIAGGFVEELTAEAFALLRP